MKSANVNLCNTPSPVLRTSSPSRARETTVVFFPMRGKVAEGRMRGKVNKAFTLIELLVVVLIIGILAAVALPQYQKAVAKSRVTQLLVRADAIYKASQVYYLAHGAYPLDLRELDLGVEASGATYGKTTISNGDHVGIIYNGDTAGIRCASLANLVGERTGMIFCTDLDYAIIIETVTGKRYCRNRAKTKLAGEVCRSMAVGEGEDYGGYTDYPLN